MLCWFKAQKAHTLKLNGISSRCIAAQLVEICVTRAPVVIVQLYFKLLALEVLHKHARVDWPCRILVQEKTENWPPPQKKIGLNEKIKSFCFRSQNLPAASLNSTYWFERQVVNCLLVNVGGCNFFLLNLIDFLNLAPCPPGPGPGSDFGPPRCQALGSRLTGPTK